jgi:hypothetical protein
MYISLSLSHSASSLYQSRSLDCAALAWSNIFGFIVLEVLSQHFAHSDGTEEIESADEGHDARDLDRDEHIATHIFVRPLGTASKLRLRGVGMRRRRPWEGRGTTVLFVQQQQAARF